MSDDYRSVIAELWKSLGLPPPVFTPAGSAKLTFDNIPVELAASADGRAIEISGQAGTLSDNPALMAEQVTHILKANMRALSFSRACVSLIPQEPKPPSIAVRALSPCNKALMDLLVEAIGDVLQAIEEHSRELARYTPSEARRPRLVGEAWGDAIILRP